MFRKVKNWLGIEGVKIELDVPEVVTSDMSYIPGKIRFLSKTNQTIEQVELKLIERYVRGRGDEKKIDEYQLGQMMLNKAIQVPGETSLEMEFKLPFQLKKSEMDEIGSKNFLNKGLVSIARWINAVDSKFYIIAEANVKGVALDPFVKLQIVIE